jgi:hypothetical protein
MKNVGDRSLILAVVFIGFLIAALTWLVGVNPRLSAAAQAREATADQNSQNDLLSLTLLQRQRDAELVPEYTRELYEIRDELPPTEDIPGVRRIINEIVTEAGLVVENDHFSSPVLVPGGVSLETQMAEVGLTSSIEGLTFTTLWATDFGFEVQGTWDQVVQVILGMENTRLRYFQMNSVNVVFVESEAGATGEVRGTLSGTFFTLDPGDPNITVRPPRLPWPGSERESTTPETPRNPFLPIVG